MRRDDAITEGGARIGDRELTGGGYNFLVFKFKEMRFWGEGQLSCAS